MEMKKDMEVKKEIKVKIKELQSTNIYIIDNVFDDELCDKLIDYIDSSNTTRLSFSNKNNVECFSVNNIEQNNVNKFVIENIRKIFELVTGYNNRINVSAQTLFELRKVYGETRLHQDGVFDMPVSINDSPTKIRSVRSLTIVITLNDDFNGGVYHFPNQNVSIKPKKGTAILFPPYYTHPHQVSQIEPGKYRYICSSWGLDDFLANDSLDKWKYKNFSMNL